MLHASNAKNEMYAGLAKSSTLIVALIYYLGDIHAFVDGPMAMDPSIDTIDLYRHSK
jgi:hypothetical protein